MIRRINLSSYLVTTVAGNTSGAVGINNDGYSNGLGTAAAFTVPIGVDMDTGGTFAVIVRAIWEEGGRYGGAGWWGIPLSEVTFFLHPLSLPLPHPTPLKAEYGTNLIRRIELATGLVTTVAGNSSGAVVNNQGFSDGLTTSASFNAPYGVAVDPTGTFAIIVRGYGAGEGRSWVSLWDA